jgi:hypothetical protein
LRILFDKNVPIGVRRFLLKHEVHTVVDLKWHPQLEIVLGSNIWPIVQKHRDTIAAKVDAVTQGSYDFIEMPVPLKANR